MRRTPFHGLATLPGTTGPPRYIYLSRPVGPVRVAMRAEPRIPIGGGKRPVAVVTDAADGTILQRDVSDGDCGWQAWRKPLAAWGVEVVVTDDASAYRAP